MNRPDDKQIEKVLAGLATPEEARKVAKWFATDEGSEYLSKNFDEDINSLPLDNADLLIDHSVPSDKMFQTINIRIRNKNIRRWTLRAAAVLLPLVLILGLYLHLNTRVDIFGGVEYAEIYVPKGERMQMMPVEKMYNIKEIVEELKKYDFSHQRRVSFEYIVFKNVNDSPRHIAELARLLSGLKCRINLIRFHKIDDAPYEGADEKTMVAFRDALSKKGIITTIRASRGEDIRAACGLLSTKQTLKQNGQSM